MNEGDSTAGSWYEATRVATPLRPRLNFDLDVDVCVIGGGLAGLTVAREVARRGWSVAVLEANRVALAASGRNTGFVLPGYQENTANMVERVGLDPSGESASFAAPPPWGELAMTPREAFLGPQEAVPAAEAAGRIAAESLATYPPGIPNVLPGERLTAETLAYIQKTLEQGGSVRGASDRLLRTVRVAVERVTE